MLLPAVFNSLGEPVKFMARMKDRAGKNFKWTVSRSLRDATYLAYWSYVFGRSDDALQVCEFLSLFQFSGNYNLWTWIEAALALQARLHRIHGEQQDVADCVARIWGAGFVETRLEGSLLGMRNLDAVIADGVKTLETDHRVVLLKELCIVIELGGSESLPPLQLEVMFQDNLSRLQELVGVSGSATRSLPLSLKPARSATRSPVGSTRSVSSCSAPTPTDTHHCSLTGRDNEIERHPNGLALSHYN